MKGGPPAPPASTGAHLLLVEDDDAMRGTVAANLAAHGYRIVEAADVAEAIRRWDAERPDVILLDLGLPDGEGTTIIRRVRREATTPILVLSARGAEPDKVAALDAGADDYVTKPFRLGELLARIRAQVRRANPEALAAAGVRLDPAARRAWADGNELELTPKEFDLLVLLVRNAGQVVPRGRIMDEVWDENWFGSTKTLDMHVLALRRKLGDDASEPSRITTVRGVGLRFEA
jgi:DNA-binding response OmpR family regulator